MIQPYDPHPCLLKAKLKKKADHSRFKQNASQRMRKGMHIKCWIQQRRPEQVIHIFSNIRNTNLIYYLIPLSQVKLWEKHQKGSASNMGPCIFF